MKTHPRPVIAVAQLCIPAVSFSRAQYAFADPQRVIAKDEAHSQTEERFYCFGEVDGGVLTVRFTYRASVIRIIGAGYWRKGKAIYEREN
ncbi:MAG: BrnT family toxin [Candidatus Accumulibacter sp.]|uniref:BrnT family toxin n=1 Tax=Candidatus Accumulibacter affinis TaxID=2954384 RepID=A0A935TEB4_9PROT|nr:BrnT family toxin [Candidatus Accumulibacter affinis]